MSPHSPEAIELLRTVRRLVWSLIIVFVVAGVLVSITFTRLRDSQERGNELQACRSYFASEFSAANGDVSRLVLRAIRAEDRDAYRALADDAAELDRDVVRTKAEYQAAAERSVNDPGGFLEECRETVG